MDLTEKKLESNLILTSHKMLENENVKSEIFTPNKNKYLKNNNFPNMEIIQIAANILKFPKKSIKHIDENIYNNYLNTRIELNGYCGIIKYIGNSKHKKETDNILWLGIEWDEESRGKHDGTVENYNYFDTKNKKNSGSLIKISKVNFGISLEEALKFKYNFENQKNEKYDFMNNLVENEAYIKANKKRIEIEFVGKEKAIKKYSDYKNFPRIDLSNSYISNLYGIREKLPEMFPKLIELDLSKSLISKWSDLSFIILNLKKLESLNFSENKLEFDKEFYVIKNLLNSDIDNKDIMKSNHDDNSDFSNKSNINIENKKNLNLKNLILNKNFLSFEDLMKISFLFPQLENLYLFDNDINENYLPPFLEKKTVTEFKSNLNNLKILSLEKNNICKIDKLLNYFPNKNLISLNLSQNSIKHLINISKNTKKEEDYCKNSFVEDFNFVDFFINLKYLNLDFNAIYDYDMLFNQLKYLSNLEELNILNNGFVRNKNVGMENAEVNIIGRLLRLTVLNNSTISKGLKRDSELIYLKNSVKDYFLKIVKEDFILEKFEEHMKEFHPNYFVLKKKYFDPVEDFIEGIKPTNTNTIKGNMIEFTFKYKEKSLKKKFPKTTTFYNLKNLLMRLFKINGTFIFRIISYTLLDKLKLFNNKKPLEEVEKENHSPDEIIDVTDESRPLEDFNITEKDVILLI